MNLRLNIGCGQAPIKGWKNFDNSASILLAHIPLLPRILSSLNILKAEQIEFIHFASQNNTLFCDASRKIPEESNTAKVIYSSHMLEHLDRHEARSFLKETYRTLIPGGILRISVPDLKILINDYMCSGTANSFIDSSHVCVPKPKTFLQRLKLIISGTRHHSWMYDGNSLVELLKAHHFENVAIMPVGQTQIANHTPLNLSESVYVEGRKPMRQGPINSQH